MNAVSELIDNRRKLVRDVACLTAEGRLFQRTAPHLCLKGFILFVFAFSCHKFDF